MTGPGYPPQQSGGWGPQDPQSGGWHPQQGPPTGQWGPQGTGQWGPQATGQWNPQSGPPPAPPAPKRKVVPIVAALLVTVALTVGGLYFFGAFSTEVRVEPVAYTDPDQFTASVGDGQAVPAPSAAPAGSAAAQPVPTAVTGNVPGLYGGTGTNSCDVNQLVTFLQATPDKAAAWAGVLGISTTDIPTYVAGLTPVLLRVDTAVTNHGFKNGKATTVNSVLQAGSAVLVDANGVPRVRCKCGNPLLEGKKFSRSSYTGTQWSGFNANSVSVVTPSAQPIPTFTLVNPTTGSTYQQPSGSTVTVATTPGASAAATPSASAVPSAAVTPSAQAGATPAPGSASVPAPGGSNPAPQAGGQAPQGGNPPPATGNLPAWNGRSYNLPKQPDKCENVPQSSCDGVLPSTFQTTITCSGPTVCTAGNGLRYTYDSGLWISEKQLPTSDALTCNGAPVPTTRVIQVGLDPDGTVQIGVTVSADTQGCGTLLVSAQYNGKPS